MFYSSMDAVSSTQAVAFIVFRFVILSIYHASQDTYSVFISSANVYVQNHLTGTRIILILLS